MRFLFGWGWGGRSKYFWVWILIRFCIGELGYVVFDGREVWEVSVMEAVAVAVIVFGVL